MWVSGFYDGSWSGGNPLFIEMYDGNMNLTERFPVRVVNNSITDFIYSSYLPGRYHILLYDASQGEYMEYTSIDVVTINDAAIYAGEDQYHPGEIVDLAGFYWGSYNGLSSIAVFDPNLDPVEWVYVYVVDDYFFAYVGGYHLPGRYVVFLFDDSSELAATADFMIIEPYPES